MVREQQSLRRLHILLVDSDPGLGERIQQALGEAGVVRSVTSLAEAREYLETDIPDVLICELVVGRESGLDLCRSIRRNAALKHLPIMLLTSFSTLQDKVAGFEAGADDYVVKPFDTRHLLARIRLLTRIKRIEQNDISFNPSISIP